MDTERDKGRERGHHADRRADGNRRVRADSNLVAALGIAASSGDALTRPLKTAEKVARDLVHDIVAEALAPGAPLPPESKLLERYGTSRESLREALRLLEEKGLIRIRRGPSGGTTVGEVDPASLGRISTLFYHLAGATYAELLDAWARCEAMLAELAARNSDHEAVRSALAPLLHSKIRSHSPQEELDAFIEAHTNFHSTVARLSGNRVLELTLQTMGRIATHHVIVNSDPRRAAALLEADHLEIARAIDAGDAEAARESMDEHIRRVGDVFRNQFGPELDDYIEWR